MDGFLLFRPFSRLPFGSLDSEVRGCPFLMGFLTMKMENAVFPAAQMKKRKVPAKRHRQARNKSTGHDFCRRFVLGRL